MEEELSVLGEIKRLTNGLVILTISPGVKERSKCTIDHVSTTLDILMTMLS
jgi:hypothetical protein